MISVGRHFVHNGTYQHEKEDISFHLFNNLDFTKDKRPISFFRSDFRGSRFLEVNFYRNNFDRADFISCNFTDCSLVEIKFGNCEIKNCYFENVIFERNIYDGIAAHQSSFVNCKFVGEHILATMHMCKFEGCSFLDCSFERSSTERLEFINCEMIDTDIATMHAEGHSFISCKLQNVCIGSSYIFGYLSHDTNFEDADFLYRGKKVSLDVIKNSYESFSLQARHFEFLNASMMLEKNPCILSIIEKSLDSLSKIDIVQFRKTEILNILDAVFFYVKFSKIPFTKFIDTIGFLNNFNWKQFAFDEYLEYMGAIEKISSLVSAGEYHLTAEFLESVPKDGTALLELSYDTDDYDTALQASKDLIEELLELYNLPKNYRLVGQKRGSWVLTFAVPLVFSFLVHLSFKNYKKVSAQISLDIKKIEKAGVLLDDVDSCDEFERFMEVTSTLSKSSPAEIPKLSGKVIEFIAKGILTLVKIII